MNTTTADTTMPRRRIFMPCTSRPTAAITRTSPKPAWTARRMCPWTMAHVALCATPLKYSGGLEPGWSVGIFTNRLSAMPSRNCAISITSAYRKPVRSGGYRSMSPISLWSLAMNVFEAAGGSATFKTLVERFYARVASDPVLRSIYPEEDLSSATERLTLFLIQYWGGPTTYSAQRGHPRLRLRHQPFAIGQAERDAWLKHMTAAVNSLDLSPEVRKAMLDYFETTSTAMINRPSRPEPSLP